MRSSLVFLLLIILFISGCNQETKKQAQTLQEQKIQEPKEPPARSDVSTQPAPLVQPPPPPQIDKKPQPQPTIRQPGTCDGICDNYEQQHHESGCYKPDCLGIKDEFNQSVQPPQQSQPYQQQAESISVQKINSTYKIATSKPSGWFKTGQDADIMLSGIDFNNAGGPLLFNHPGAVTSDGLNLFLADRNNNRVLIWNKLPTANKEPDLVLGQKTFNSNNPGRALDELNWPVSVAAANGKVVVADTYNDRILIWNNFPTRNGQPADIQINDIGPGNEKDPKRKIGWPWAVWIDGKKLIVTSTASASVLIWNSFPTTNNQPADIVLHANGNFGTPRSISSDGKHLVIGDHNAKVSGGPGNFFWKIFPTKDDQKYDFFANDPYHMGAERRSEGKGNGGDILWGAMTSGGRFIAIANLLYIWNTFPDDKNDAADLVVGGVPGQEGYDFGGSQSGDGSGAVLADGRLYLSLSNGNKIVGFNSIPTKTDQEPDFVIGAPDINTNTLQTNFIMSNAVPATDGKSLFISSDFDRKLYVWKNLPDQSNAHPDFVYNLSAGGDNVIFENKLALIEKKTIYIWNSLPLNGEKPDLTFSDSIGNIHFADIRGIAMDYKYFYLSDGTANKIYVWDGIPTKNQNPKFVLETDQPWRLSSDGKYLAATSTLSGSVKIYLISDLSSNAQPIILRGKFNLPQDALVYNGKLFVADTVFNRVQIWKNIEDAIAGKDADVILGAKDLQDIDPEIGKNKLFWPGALAFDGSYLWVGEFKFSGRLLRFSVH